MIIDAIAQGTIRVENVSVGRKKSPYYRISIGGKSFDLIYDNEADKEIDYLKSITAGIKDHIEDFCRIHYNPDVAKYYETVLRAADQDNNYANDYAYYNRDFIAGGGRQTEISLGWYLSSLQDEALNKLCEDIGSNATDLPKVSYKEDKQGGEEFANKAHDYFYVEDMLPQTCRYLSMS